jgi:hypothetical protein
MKYNAPTDATDPNASYVQGNASLGISGSKPPAIGFEGAQREIVNAITAAGLTPTNSDMTQLAQAIRAVPPAYTISGVLTLGSSQSVSNNVNTTIGVAGTLPFATVSGGVATITQAGRYAINATMRTTIVTTGAVATYGNPHLYLNGSTELGVSSASQYSNAAYTNLVAGSTSVSGVFNVGDQISLVAQCGSFGSANVSSITVTAAIVNFLKLA